MSEEEELVRMSRLLAREDLSYRQQLAAAVSTVVKIIPLHFSILAQTPFFSLKSL